jgi:epoxide hydrolase-like predicted phosphatase
MKPAIIFDLGKVLVDFDYSIAAKKIAACSAKQLPDLQHFLGSSPVLQRFENGDLTREQFFVEMQQITGFTGALEKFVADFADIFIPIPAMIDLQAGLRQRGFQTYIFSNTNDIAIEHISREFQFFKNFDDYIYSYKIGAMKPDVRIYEVMEKFCGRVSSDIVYIDDRAENVAAGASRGWWTILHETPEKTRAILEKYLMGRESLDPSPKN